MPDASSHAQRIVSEVLKGMLVDPARQRASMAAACALAGLAGVLSAAGFMSSGAARHRQQSTGGEDQRWQQEQQAPGIPTVPLATGQICQFGHMVQQAAEGTHGDVCERGDAADDTCMERDQEAHVDAEKCACEPSSKSVLWHEHTDAAHASDSILDEPQWICGCMENDALRQQHLHALQTALDPPEMRGRHKRVRIRYVQSRLIQRLETDASLLRPGRSAALPNTFSRSRLAISSCPASAPPVLPASLAG